MSDEKKKVEKIEPSILERAVETISIVCFPAFSVEANSGFNVMIVEPELAV